MSHAALLKRHQAVMPSWMNLYYEQPIHITRGFGRRVVDAEGKGYLDFFGGIAVNSLGYNIPEVRDALRRQLARGIHHTSTLYLVEQQIELGERIAALSGIRDAKVFFVNSGTEAMEAALLFATAARRCGHVLALRNGYHGRSFGSNATTGVHGWTASPLSPLQVSYVHNGHRLRGPLSHLGDEAVVSVCLEDLREVVATAGPDTIAALVAEPMQGVGGLTVPPPGLLRAYQRELAGHGIPLIVDEVQTGWGRLGSHFWGSGFHGVRPDLLAFAKGLGNGLAVGGVVGRPDLIDAVSAHSMSTFGGNQLAMTAAVAAIDVMLSRNTQANAEAVGGLLKDGLIRLAAGDSRVAEVRGRGLLLAVEFVDPHTGQPDPETTRRVHEATRERGLLVGRGGPEGNVIRISPPLTLTADEAVEGLAVLGAVLHDHPAHAD